MRELLRAAFVIARRDYMAVVLSKTFILFLIGPLFPVLFGFAFGSLGERVASDGLRSTIGVAMPKADRDALIAAHGRLVGQLGPQAVPGMEAVSVPLDDAAADRLLTGPDHRFTLILSGTLAAPELIGRRGDVDRATGEVGLILDQARAARADAAPRIATRLLPESKGPDRQAQMLTGRSAQILLFLLTILLAGMVLSNMVEEKTNKIIEILAAAVPIDAIFIGKLAAMLTMSLTGIAIWGGGVLAFLLTQPEGLPDLPDPAVGWPVFILLGVLYFAMAYTLLGALFIGVGSQASTVRQVQTLNMPVTMGQMILFFFASHASGQPDSAMDIAAAVIPFSSPFAMIARAAISPLIWPHVMAVTWQIVWVAIIVRMGTGLFRRNVLKSGGGRGTRRRKAASV